MDLILKTQNGLRMVFECAYLKYIQYFHKSDGEAYVATSIDRIEIWIVTAEMHPKSKIDLVRQRISRENEQCLTSSVVIVVVVLIRIYLG
jgi:hypothetical protein